MTDIRDHLPLPLPEARMLDEDQSAAYAGIGPRLFRQLADLDIFQPIRIGTPHSKKPRRLYDRHAIDVALDAIVEAGGVTEYLTRLGHLAATPADE